MEGGTVMAITRPVTKTIISTADFGIPVVDQLNTNTAALAAQVPTAWTSVTFMNCWNNYAGYVTQYRKVGDMVQVRGGAAGPAIGTTIYILPVGFRPPAVLQFPQASWSVVGVIQVDPSGGVFAQASINPQFSGMAYQFSITP
jgi:hypothetical protein